jgi:hypothetical protein
MNKSTTKEVTANNKIAQIAMNVTEEHERKQNRNPKLMAHKKGLGYDVEAVTAGLKLKALRGHGTRTNQVSNMFQKMNVQMLPTYIWSAMLMKNLNCIFSR